MEKILKEFSSFQYCTQKENMQKYFCENKEMLQAVHSREPQLKQVSICHSFLAVCLLYLYHGKVICRKIPTNPLVLGDLEITKYFKMLLNTR